MDRHSQTLAFEEAKIIKIEIWPIDTSRFSEPHEISLSPKHINIFVSPEKTGKSTLWPLIDFCLASSKLKTRNAHIMSCVEWVSLTLKNNTGIYRLSRKIAESQHDSCEIIAISLNHISPKSPRTENRPKANCTKDEYKDFVAPLIEGFPTTTLGPLSMRDLVTLNRVSQFTIGNPLSAYAYDPEAKGFLKLLILFETLIGSPESENRFYTHFKQMSPSQDIREIWLFTREVFKDCIRVAHAQGLSIMQPETAEAALNYTLMIKELANIYNKASSLIKSQSEDADGYSGQNRISSNHELGRLAGRCEILINLLKLLRHNAERVFEVKNEIAAGLQLVKTKYVSNNFLEEYNKKMKFLISCVGLADPEIDYILDPKTLGPKAVVKDSVRTPPALGGYSDTAILNVSSSISTLDTLIELKMGFPMPLLFVDGLAQALSITRSKRNQEMYVSFLTKISDFLVSNNNIHVVLLEREIPEALIANEIINIEYWSKANGLIPFQWTC